MLKFQSNRMSYLGLTTKKLISLMKRDQKSVAADPLFRHEEWSIDFEFVFVMLLSYGFIKLNWASLERDCKGEDLFCSIKRSN